MQNRANKVDKGYQQRKEPNVGEQQYK